MVIQERSSAMVNDIQIDELLELARNKPVTAIIELAKVVNSLIDTIYNLERSIQWLEERNDKCS